ncbi:hypothetical protein CBR_g8295 [Chara braunii]|uniref:Oxysterol-binding protein n=1 Tax=Chara braunii TaxID=69332 RepID=A0A388KLR6_CHABU|nr:hypothetical protein CBR_g8295 [Chara braunii]|eukprot:GBG70996.1 hypothetical protein CBR_g8295 [Chara braunii]
MSDVALLTWHCAQNKLATYQKASLDGEGIEGDDEGEEEDEDEDNETDDEALVDSQVVPSDAGDEEYFEALEVLHHHDYLVRSSSAGDPVVLPEQAGVAEPPEEVEGMGEAETETEVEREDLIEPRTRLPAPRPLNRGFSLWSILKNAIGKDLNRITLPATVNEPLSVLQRCAEELEYRSLLEAAVRQESSMERMLLVAAFACSSYYRSILRDAKPFNPLLGETYEWASPEGRTKFIAEQVSHHPPIMAFNCEGLDGQYCIYGEMELRNKFWGKSVEILPIGVCHLRIPKFKDHYTWNKVTTCVHNVVVGKLWIDNYGEMLITNHTTGETCRLRFHKATSQEQGRVAGKAFDAKGVAVYSIHGNYMDKISATPEALAVKSVAPASNGATPKPPRLLWKGTNQLENSVQQYSFSQFTVGLNELTPKLAEVLPPTDSRFRPDQRALRCEIHRRTLAKSDGSLRHQIDYVLRMTS